MIRKNRRWRVKRYDAVIFDLYGTLADIHTDESRPALWRSLAAFYASRGAVYSPAALRAAYLRRVEDRLSAVGGAWPEIDVTEVFSDLFAGAGIPPEPRWVEAAAGLFRRESTTHLRAYAGAAEVLSALRRSGRKVFLLSNAQRCFTMPELETLGLSHSFDGIYISSDYGVKKPDPRFFRTLLGREALEPQQCLMVGNDPVCDAAGAKEAGLDAWYVRSGLTPRDAPPPEDVPADYRQNGTDLRALCRAVLSDRR